MRLTDGRAKIKPELDEGRPGAGRTRPSAPEEPPTWPLRRALGSPGASLLLLAVVKRKFESVDAVEGFMEGGGKEYGRGVADDGVHVIQQDVVVRSLVDLGDDALFRCVDVIRCFRIFRQNPQPLFVIDENGCRPGRADLLPRCKRLKKLGLGPHQRSSLRELWGTTVCAWFSQAMEERAYR
jgi:hypothetical protein